MEWITKGLLSIPVKSTSVRFINTPLNFYATLLDRIGKSKSRIFLSKLYLGTGELEKRFVKLPEDRKCEKPELPNYFRGIGNEMDSIRARGFLKYCYKYNPPVNIYEMVESVAKKNGVSGNLDDFDAKQAILKEIGAALRHFVPNSRLHKVKTVADVVAFYSEPVNNITKYAEMARDDRLPQNIAIREHAVRFHPNDKKSLHGGIPAFPGVGGEVLSIRQKRLTRQYRLKKEWFEFEDQAFDFEPVDKGMPWDPEVAKQMDRYVTKRFLTNKLRKIKNV